MTTLLCVLGLLFLAALFIPRMFAVCLTLIFMIIFSPIIGLILGIIAYIVITNWSKKNMP